MQSTKCRMQNYRFDVIPRRGKAPTRESPAYFREIATPACALVRNDTIIVTVQWTA